MIALHPSKYVLFYPNVVVCLHFTQLVRKYIALGVKPSSIGVITPYWAQVRITSQNCIGEAKDFLRNFTTTILICLLL